MKEKTDNITKSEKRKYVLKTKRDIKILKICKKFEKIKLSKKDSDLVALIKTQLERNWRKHLLTELEKLLKKYNT